MNDITSMYELRKKIQKGEKIPPFIFYELDTSFDYNDESKQKTNNVIHTTNDLNKNIAELMSITIELLKEKEALIKYLEDKIKECDNYTKYIDNKIKELHGRASGKTYIAGETLKNEVAKKIYQEILDKIKEGNYE